MKIWIAVLTLGISASAVLPSSRLQAEDYYPDHPVVQEMINKGVGFLENPTEGRGASGMFEIGTPILAAYATFKVRDDATLPVVQRGVNVAFSLLSEADNDAVRRANEKYFYEISVAAILLATVDPDRYRPQCVIARDVLLRYSRSFGGWGYLNGFMDTTTGMDRSKQGDISQTQYAILALWTLDQMGVVIDPEPMERTARFLMDVQDTEGGWGYQGMNKVAGREAQTPVTHSLSAAGLGSLLIAGDFLGFYRNRKADAQEPDIPKAFRQIIENSDSFRSTSMDRGDTDESVDLGVRWHDTNAYVRPGGMDWHYYYRYAEERFRSFHEIAKGRPEKSPRWYNIGVEEMRKNQHASGGWGIDPNTDADHCPPELATAFAILYLTRATQKAIGASSEGIVRGGIGLPEDVSDVSEMDGKIVDNAKISSFEEILKLLESEDPTKVQEVVVTDKLKLEKDPRARKEQLNRLSRLLRSRDVKARRAAAKLLGRGDDLDFVPSLIFALDDGDREVCLNAENSLRILSRQLDTRFLPDLASENRHYSKAERAISIEKWKAWFRSVRPDYIFAIEG
jgi:hypothetical protein